MSRPSKLSMTLSPPAALPVLARPVLLFLGLVLLLAAPFATARLSEPPPVTATAPAARDLQQIRNSGVLRVLVNQSRSSSGEILGEAIGTESPRLEAYEDFLNGFPHDGRHVTLKIIPKAKNELLEALRRGEGDMVAPGELLDVKDHPEVSAGTAIIADVPLVLVGRKGERRFTRLEQLSGHTLVLPSGSAAGDALQALNTKLASHRLKPVQVEWVDPSLAIEDVLEMIQAGIYPLTVVELPIAQRWATAMPGLQVDSQVVVGNRGEIDWLVSRDSLQLRASIERFFKTYKMPNAREQDLALQRLYKRLYTVRSPLEKGDRQRLEKVRGVLQQHAGEHDLDWLNLAALAFKESSLDPSAQGGSGATGLLQITPAAAQHVGVRDIGKLDNNVEAAAKYLAMLRKQYFNSPRIAERDRMAFALAAYNMGPDRVQSLRAEARKEGLNPNQWFFQVERVAMNEVGVEAVSYVNSVNKYYLAYDRQRDSLEPRSRKSTHK